MATNKNKSGFGIKYVTLNLIAKHGNVDDIKEISKITDLDLSFDSNEEHQIIKLENLDKCQSLKRLIVNRQALNRMIGIEKLYNLIELDLSGNNLEKIECIKSLKLLQKLDLSFNSITNIAPSISYLSQLNNLKLSNNKIQNVCFIQNCVKIFYFYIFALFLFL